MASKNKSKFDWRKARKERKEIEEEEDDEDDPDEQPATDAVIEALGVNPDELFDDEKPKRKSKSKRTIKS